MAGLARQAALSVSRGHTGGVDGTRARGRRGLVVATVGVGVLAAGAASAVGATRPPPDRHPRVARDTRSRGPQQGSAPAQSGSDVPAGGQQGSGGQGGPASTGQQGSGGAPGAADGQQPDATSNGS
jgi:hypothetical protein